VREAAWGLFRSRTVRGRALKYRGRTNRTRLPRTTRVERECPTPRSWRSGGQRSGTPLGARLIQQHDPVRASDSPAPSARWSLAAALPTRTSPHVLPPPELSHATPPCWTSSEASLFRTPPASHAEQDCARCSRYRQCPCGLITSTACIIIGTTWRRQYSALLAKRLVVVPCSARSALFRNNMDYSVST